MSDYVKMAEKRICTISLLCYIDPSMITTVLEKLNIKYVLNEIQDMCILSCN